jgi:hypothetical protein
MEIIADSSFGRKVARQHTLSATGFCLIKNGVENMAKVGCSGTTARGKNNDRMKEFPLGVGQIGRIIWGA